jgi:hypothetical protein
MYARKTLMKTIVTQKVKNCEKRSAVIKVAMQEIHLRGEDTGSW